MNVVNFRKARTRARAAIGSKFGTVESRSATHQPPPISD
jgi:hypothetical protein